MGNFSDHVTDARKNYHIKCQHSLGCTDKTRPKVVAQSILLAIHPRGKSADTDESADLGEVLRRPRPLSTSLCFHFDATD